MVMHIYKRRSEIYGPFSPKIWWPKNVNFLRDFGQLYDLIVNISGIQQDIVSRKIANCDYSSTPTQNQLFRMLISRMLGVMPRVKFYKCYEMT